jgi:hypothetical protein
MVEKFNRDTLQDALQVVCGPRFQSITIGYTPVTKDVVPLLAWEVDWPLVRRGRRLPAQRQAKVQGALPWEEVPNQSLLTIYQSVPSVGMFGMFLHEDAKPVVRLEVAGRTPDEAVANWHRCAKALRLMRKTHSTGQIEKADAA